MALANNTRDQLARKLKQNVESLCPGFSAQLGSDQGDAALAINDSAGVEQAAAVIRRKTFVGLNIVAELSSSAAEGLPEHDLFLVVKPDASPALVARLVKACALLGTASMKIVTNVAPAAAQAIEANVAAEIPNSAEFGAVGI